MSEYKIILKKEDYDFIDYLIAKYKIPIGKGYKNFIEIAINEYKLKNAENKTQAESKDSSPNIN